MATILILSVCCEKNTSVAVDEIVLRIGETTEIPLGKTAFDSQNGLSLRVENIHDSRCPTGVMCVWEGNASVEFHLTTKNGIYDFNLDTHYHPMFKNDTVIEGINYHLSNVLPWPDINKEQPVKTVEILVECN